MRASTSLVLLGVPPSLESVAVIVAMVTLVLVASHTYDVILVHKIIITVSLYNYLKFFLKLQYFALPWRECCRLYYPGIHVSGSVAPMFSSQVPAKTHNSLADGAALCTMHAWVAVITIVYTAGLAVCMRLAHVCTIFCIKFCAQQSHAYRISSMLQLYEPKGRARV